MDSRFLTLVPPTALVIIGYYLGDQKLGEGLIMRNAGQHFTELSDYRHELDRSL